MLTSERPGWVQDCNSMLASAVCHLAGLVALGLWSVVSHDGWSGVRLFVSSDPGAESISLDDAPLDAVQLEVAATDAAAAAEPIRLFDAASFATADLAALDALTDSSAAASGFDGLALAGAGDADGLARGGAAKFFGIGGYGQSFVYVVDCSDSMNDARKFERAVYELLHSIEQLGSDQRYFIIFFNDGAYPMEAEQPVPADENEFARTRQWIQHVRPNGGTHPLPALLFALSLRPDAIYFLSDGQFDRGTIHQLRTRNRANKRLGTRAIPIHTIAFVDRATEGLMRTIAKNSGGKFRFVK